MGLPAPNSEVLVHEYMMMNVLCPNIGKMIRISWFIWVQINVLMQIVSVLYVFNKSPCCCDSPKVPHCKVSQHVFMIFFQLITYVKPEENDWDTKVEIIDKIKFRVCFFCFIFIKSDPILVIQMSGSFGKCHKLFISHLPDLRDQWFCDINHCVQPIMYQLFFFRKFFKIWIFHQFVVANEPYSHVFHHFSCISRMTLVIK